MSADWLARRSLPSRATPICEVAENDPELKRAIEAAEQTREGPAEVQGKTPANVDAVTEQQRDRRPEEAERRPDEPSEQAH